MFLDLKGNIPVNYHVYLIYVDESGSNSWSSPNDIFVLGGTIIHEETWILIDREINNFKKNLVPTANPSEWELHASPMMDGRGFFKIFKKQERFSMISETYKLIGNLQLTIIGVAIFKDQLRKRIDLEEWGFRLLYERLLKYLDKVNRIGGKKEMGIVLIDSINKKVDQQRSNLFYEFMNQGTLFSIANDYLIERPLFVKSQYRNMSQIADMISYLIRRKLLKNDYYFNKYFNFVKPRFDTCSSGRIIGCGLKLFPDQPHLSF